MTLTYLDTSAAMKLLVHEPETSALQAELASKPDRRLLASWLLHTELHCAAGRHASVVSVDAVNIVLASVTLVDVTRGDLIAAGGVVPLRSNDAIHLATAVRLAVDEVLTYDEELATAAVRHGLTAVGPS